MAIFTYGQMRDYIYHRLFQNLATESIKSSDISLAINLSQAIYVASTSNPKLFGFFEKELDTAGKTFEFDYDIKQVFKIVGVTDEGTEYELSQVFKTPAEISTKNNLGETVTERQFQIYQNTVVTGENYKKIVLQGERFLEDIQDISTDWDKTFPLGVKIAGIVCEYCMGLLSPMNIADGYNLSNYHYGVYNNMVDIMANSLGNIAGVKKISNKVY